MLNTLPEDWIPVEIQNEGIWRQIDIDDDQGKIEYLIFFTYNNADPSTNSGPTGTLVFDFQNNSEYFPASNTLAMPYQPSGSFIPYRPLPNYWIGSGDGFVAPRGGHASVTMDVITRSGERQQRTVTVPPSGGEDAADPVATSAPVKELLVQGDGNTVSVIWWRDLIDGYRAASVHAAGGIRAHVYETPNNSETPLKAFEGYHPFHDRSDLCAVTFYEREYLTTTVSAGQVVPVLDTEPLLDIRFNETPLSVNFCKSPASIPFYPEAVVLRYLLTKGQEEAPHQQPANSLTDFPDESASDATADVLKSITENKLRISGIFAPRQIRFQPQQDSHASVCVEFTDDNAASDAPLSARRSAAMFRLRHEKPEINYESTDEFRIERAAWIPVPKEKGLLPVDCNDFVENGTPGRNLTP